jgi:hypothetical protein
MILLRHGESEFNLIHDATGEDPEIRDPHGSGNQSRPA